jgi:glycosyltransferase involved in cell wall biosynthesis
VWVIVFKGKKTAVVMPAYSAAKSIRKTYDKVMAQDIVDLVIIVYDANDDDTGNFGVLYFVELRYFVTNHFGNGGGNNSNTSCSLRY